MPGLTGNTVGLWSDLNYRSCRSPSVGVAIRRFLLCEGVVGVGRGSANHSGRKNSYGVASECVVRPEASRREADLTAMGQVSSLRVVESSALGDADSVQDKRSPDVANLPLTRRTAPLAIQVKNCVLQYPLGAYARGSLKSLIMSVFGHRERAP